MSKFPLEPDGWIDSLESALEHGSHAWNALRKAGLAHVPDEEHESWPPECTDAAGSAAYHVAAMLGYVWAVFNGLAEAYPRLDESTMARR